ncbi:protease inhibitor I42 family protein [candidate division WOR-3 bacterium]|nr:protease inhibitor I42 family protein [candidate division WOR-3 bacterium]
MNKFVYLVYILIFGCAGHKNYIVDNTFDGDSITVRINKPLKIVLPSNPSTGFQWNPCSTDKNIVSFDSSFFSAKNEGLLGSPGEQVFTIRILREVELDLVFYYSREWEEVPPTDTFEIFIKTER